MEKSEKRKIRKNKLFWVLLQIGNSPFSDHIDPFVPYAPFL